MNEWLLCDFHIHTTWSDGSLPVSEVVDLYGKHGFDCINISDHYLDKESALKVCEEVEIYNYLKSYEHRDYIKDIGVQAERALVEYDMLVMPGLEMSNNIEGYHIVGIDFKNLLNPGLSPDIIIEEIHKGNGLAQACHPFPKDEGRNSGLDQSYFLRDHIEQYADLFDVWEVANRHHLYNKVGLRELNWIGNSDFHRPEDIFAWKTMVKSEKTIKDIKKALLNNKNKALFYLTNQN